MKKIYVVILAITFLYLFISTPWQYPNSLLYPIKRVSEETKLRLTFDSEARALYFSGLVERRFKELVYIVESEKTGFYPETQRRYTSFLGKYLARYKGKGYLEQNREEYLSTLSRLRDRYPANSPYWLILEQAVGVTRNL